MKLEILCPQTKSLDEVLHLVSGAHFTIANALTWAIVEFGNMEMKIFLAKLLRTYDWSITPNSADLFLIRVPPQLIPILQNYATHLIPLAPLKKGGIHS